MNTRDMLRRIDAQIKEVENGTAYTPFRKDNWILEGFSVKQLEQVRRFVQSFPLVKE